MSNSIDTAGSTATIQRIVCFKFKEGVTNDQIQAHINDFDALRNSIPYIFSHTAGKTILGELEVEPEYDVMHYITFLKEEDIKLYYYHPTHLEFYEKHQHIWEKFLVINSLLP